MSTCGLNDLAFADVDWMLAPVLPCLPATSFPLGLDEVGLPLSAQASGPFLEDVKAEPLCAVAGRCRHQPVSATTGLRVHAARRMYGCIVAAQRRHPHCVLIGVLSHCSSRLHACGVFLFIFLTSSCHEPSHYGPPPSID